MSKAIVDLCDVASIMSRPSVEELKVVEGFSRSFKTPNVVMDIFKNRRGRWTMVRVWSVNDLGTCRRQDLFITTPDMKAIDEFQIIDFIEEISEEQQELIDKLNDGIERKEIKINQSENPTKSLLEEVKEDFGSKEERKKRLKDVDWNNLL